MNREPIPWFLPEVGEPEQQHVAEAIRINYINDGPITRKLEKSFANYFQVKHAIGVTSGTTAITLSLMGLGIKPGDEVIVPDFTFIATANAVRLAGATPRLVDIEPHRFTLSVKAAKKAINSKTKAIVTVDINGRGCDYSEIKALCKKHKLHLVTDSAQALGSHYKNQFIGTFGITGCFSFSANKTVSSGQGGLIITDDTPLYHRIKELKDQGRRETGTGGDDAHPALGFNFKYTGLQAAVAQAQFERLPQRIAGFSQRDRWYQERLKHIPGLVLPPYDEPGEVRQWSDVLILKKRDKVVEALTEAKIGCRPFFRPLHRQEPYHRKDKLFPNSCKITAQGLWLPSSFHLTQEQVERTVKIIRDVLK
ncbi:DegT/DnrJ/EryC1/StrS family aminotransferase [Magnetococcales bacterium HHB-1]